MKTNKQKRIQTFSNMNRFEKYSDGVISLSNRSADRVLLICPVENDLALITYIVDGQTVFSTRQNLKQAIAVVLGRFKTIANLSD